MLTCGKLNKQLRFSLPSIHSPFAPTRLLQRSEKEPRPLKSSVIFFRSCSGRRKREDVKKSLILVVLGFALYGLYERNPNFFPAFAEQSTTEPRARKVTFDMDNMWVELTDGRQLGVPLAYFPRLLNATRAGV